VPVLFWSPQAVRRTGGSGGAQPGARAAASRAAESGTGVTALGTAEFGTGGVASGTAASGGRTLTLPSEALLEDAAN
jgi:hypothetical protein